jgi:hypothetical protein
MSRFIPKTQIARGIFEKRTKTMGMLRRRLVDRQARKRAAKLGHNSVTSGDVIAALKTDKDWFGQVEKSTDE